MDQYKNVHDLLSLTGCSIDLKTAGIATELFFEALASERRLLLNSWVEQFIKTSLLDLEAPRDAIFSGTALTTGAAVVRKRLCG